MITIIMFITIIFYSEIKADELCSDTTVKALDAINMNFFQNLFFITLYFFFF